MPTEEWIGKLAESEGVSREVVLEQLVSSYWTLKEMHGLMEQTEEGREAPSEEWALDIESLYSDAVAEDIDELTERVERLEDGDTGADVTALRGEIDMLAERVNGVEESVVGRQDDMEGRLDEEFANLARILDYLIETTDALEDGLESLSDEQESGRRWREQWKQLTDLKRLASRLDVRTAKCGYCGKSVDIALLPSPECPQCDRRFTDIEPGKRWFGLGSNTLVVSEDPYIDDGGRTDGGEDEGGPVTGDEFVGGGELG